MSLLMSLIETITKLRDLLRRVKRVVPATALMDDEIDKAIVGDWPYDYVVHGKLGSIDVTLCEHYPPGHTGGLHATHGERGLWPIAALLDACGIQGEVGQELRIVVERKNPA